MDDQAIALALSFIGAAAFGLAAWSLADVQRRFVKSGGARMPTGERSPLFRLITPYVKGFSALFAAALRRRGIAQEGAPQAVPEKKPEAKRHPTLSWLYDKTRERLLAAGSPRGFEAEDYWGFIVFCILLFALLGFLAALLTGWALLFPGFLAMGAALPFAWLSDIIRRRQGRIRKELPFALDLLTLSVEAGMDFTAALGNIAERLRGGALAQEFDQAVKEINMGRQRADSLRDMAARLKMTDVNAVVSALIQADQLGTGLGGVLRIQADDVRTRRFQSAEKRAGETPTKMLFPLVAFIFPVTFLMVAAPLLVQVIRFLLAGR